MRSAIAGLFGFALLAVAARWLAGAYALPLEIPRAVVLEGAENPASGPLRTYALLVLLHFLAATLAGRFAAFGAGDAGRMPAAATVSALAATAAILLALIHPLGPWWFSSLVLFAAVTGPLLGALPWRGAAA